MQNSERVYFLMLNIVLQVRIVNLSDLHCVLEEQY